MSKKVLIGILGIIILIGICWVFNYIRFLNSLPKVEPLPISVMQDKLCPKVLHDNAIMLLEPHKCDHNIYVAHTLGSNIYYDSQGNEITTCSYDGSLSSLLGITVKGSWKCRYLRILHCEFFCPDIKEEDKTADWQTYRNEGHGFEIKYPSDWTTYDYITAGLEYNNTITKETATIEIGKKMTGVEYEGIKLAEEKIDQYISQMRTVIKPKTKIKIGDYDGYEVIGTLCTQICTGSSEDIYTPFSVIYLSDGTNIFKITYLEGISGVGWKDNINDWIHYDAYNQILSTFSFSDIEPTSIIDIISPISGPIGTKIELKGQNFTGFEGDLVAWIENIDGKKGYIWRESGSNDNLIKFTLSSSYCQVNTSYSGLPCPDYLSITPGVYKIYVNPWGIKSNEVSFTVTP